MNGQEFDNPRQSEADRLRRRYESRPAAFLSWIERYWRVHLGLIVLAAALVLADWMYVIHLDNVWSAAHPQDANGGMAAFSVALYHFFHACMLMIAILWLILLMSRFETVYAAYSKFLFGVSVTLPALMAVCFASPKWFVNPLFIRLLVSPFFLVAMAFSRWMARFGAAKKLTFLAFLMEGAALGSAVVLFYTGVL